MRINNCKRATKVRIARKISKETRNSFRAKIVVKHVGTSVSVNGAMTLLASKSMAEECGAGKQAREGRV